MPIKNNNVTGNLKSLFKGLTLVLIVFSATLAQTFSARAQSPEWNSIFERRFHRAYQPNKCGTNILNFLMELKQVGAPLRGASMIQIDRPVGFPDMVDPVQARAYGREVRWYFHVILQDTNGYIYDFDFTNHPTPVHFCDYFNEMFLDDGGNLTGSGFYTSPAQKLSDYQLTYTDATEVLRAKNERRNPNTQRVMRLGALMSRCQ